MSTRNHQTHSPTYNRNQRQQESLRSIGIKKLPNSTPAPINLHYVSDSAENLDNTTNSDLSNHSRRPTNNGSQIQLSSSYPSHSSSSGGNDVPRYPSNPKPKAQTMDLSKVILLRHLRPTCFPGKGPIQNDDTVLIHPHIRSLEELELIHRELNSPQNSDNQYVICYKGDTPQEGFVIYVRPDSTKRDVLTKRLLSLKFVKYVECAEYFIQHPYRFFVDVFQYRHASDLSVRLKAVIEEKLGKKVEVKNSAESWYAKCSNEEEILMLKARLPIYIKDKKQYLMISKKDLENTGSLKSTREPSPRLKTSAAAAAAARRNAEENSRYFPTVVKASRDTDDDSVQIIDEFKPVSNPHSIDISINYDLTSPEQRQNDQSSSLRNPPASKKRPIPITSLNSRLPPPFPHSTTTRMTVQLPQTLNAEPKPRPRPNPKPPKNPQPPMLPISPKLKMIQETLQTTVPKPHSSLYVTKGIACKLNPSDMRSNYVLLRNIRCHRKAKTRDFVKDVICNVRDSLLKYSIDTKKLYYIVNPEEQSLECLVLMKFPAPSAAQKAIAMFHGTVYHREKKEEEGKDIEEEKDAGSLVIGVTCLREHAEIFKREADGELDCEPGSSLDGIEFKTSEDTSLNDNKKERITEVETRPKSASIGDIPLNEHQEEDEIKELEHLESAQESNTKQEAQEVIEAVVKGDEDIELEVVAEQKIRPKRSAKGAHITYNSGAMFEELGMSKEEYSEDEESEEKPEGKRKQRTIKEESIKKTLGRPKRQTTPVSRSDAVEVNKRPEVIGVDETNIQHENSTSTKFTRKRNRANTPPRQMERFSARNTRRRTRNDGERDNSKITPHMTVSISDESDTEDNKTINNMPTKGTNPYSSTNKQTDLEIISSRYTKEKIQDLTPTPRNQASPHPRASNSPNALEYLVNQLNQNETPHHNIIAKQRTIFNWKDQDDHPEQMVVDLDDEPPNRKIKNKTKKEILVDNRSSDVEFVETKNIEIQYSVSDDNEMHRQL